MATDFGRSMSCVTDLLPNFGEVTGRRLLAEAAARRITTPRGALIGSPNYGIDVQDWLNDAGVPSRLAARGLLVDTELLKDPRIFRSSTALTLVAGVMTLTIALQDADGPFTLVLAISAVTVEILGIT